MPPPIEQRLAAAREKLRKADARAKRLTSYLSRLRRSIRGMERWVGRTRPPAPATPAAPAVAFRMMEAATRQDAMDARLAEMQRLGEEFARRLGVATPRVRWKGSPGACRRVARAHIHTGDSWWNRYGEERGLGKAGRRAHARGDICVNPQFYEGADEARLRRLMAHEVAHLRRSGKRPTRGHGQRMERVAKALLAETTPQPPPESPEVS